MLAQSSKQQSEQQKTGDYQRIAAAIDFIERQAHEQPSLERLAEHLGISAGHVQRLFRRWAGVTPKQFLQSITLERARQLLKQNHSVLDTSLSLGLSGPGRLHDHFVTIEAVTPGEFKSGGAGVHIKWGYSDSVFGSIFIAQSSRGICRLEFTDTGEAREFERLKVSWPNADFVRDDQMAQVLAAKIFAAGGPNDSFHVWIKGTNFQLQVWRALLDIPQGNIIHYQALAQGLSRGKATRAVASAIAANPVGFLIPCHRVLRKSGQLGGYRWGASRKQAILAWEAAQVCNTN